MKILKFGLPTCRPCVELSKRMETLDLSNYEVEEVTLNKDVYSKQLGNKYNIKSVPTLVVVDSDGNEIKRIRNIVQLKDFLKTSFVFEDKTEGLETGIVYSVSVDKVYDNQDVKITWIDRIKNIFK